MGRIQALPGKGNRGVQSCERNSSKVQSSSGIFGEPNALAFSGASTLLVGKEKFLS